MSYTINHTYADQSLETVVTQTAFHHGPPVAVDFTVECSASGTFAIGYPGKLRISASAKYQVFFEEDGVHGTSTTYHSLPLAIELRAPDGQPFTADEVTLDDLRRFRDLRGSSQGLWSFSVEGKEDIKYQGRIPEVSEIAGGRLSIVVDETVASQSAPPLVSDRLSTQGQHLYTFDLYRVGTFVATAKPDSFVGGLTGQRPMKLFDPAGAEVATSETGTLTFPVSLETLESSRDAHGNVRLWSLEVLPALFSGSAETTVWATVIATSRIHADTLNSRLDDLLGHRGSKIRIYGDMRQETLFARLEILDEISAGTIDILHLLKSVLKQDKQDPGVDVGELGAYVPYVLYSRTRDLPDEMHVSLDGVRVDTIDISIGASERIQPPIPALKLLVTVEGDAAIDLGGFSFATVSVHNNQIALEAGLRRQDDGTFSPETWRDESPLSIDVSLEADAAIVAVFGLGYVLGAAGLADYIQSDFNDRIMQGFDAVLAGAMGQVPAVLAMIMGGDFTYQSIGLDGEDIIFEYVAPLEPDPKPSPNYLGVIGRSVFQEAADIWRIRPSSLGDTWSAENLSKNIDHIVVVMMENRSFNHVLGYRAQLPGHEDSDGLTDGLITFLESQVYDGPRTELQGKNYEVRNLGSPESRIKPNVLGFKTKFPADVGHSTDDVVKQLAEPIKLPSGRVVNGPKGFVEDFGSKLDAVKPEPARTKILQEVDALDVLGYYEAKDLPFFHFLAENYAYCERYFCSHPGPTLPNRMYSLSGDLQYDRTGAAIVNNNNGDNLVLSRAVNIFDLLTRKRIGWRVYESFPSVTMLRMFARYATDETNIVPLERLQGHVALGNLPAVTVIDPRMHSAPRNDDHAPADMYEGQVFLEGVYNTLRSNGPLWERTMLIITYDEHGGFYDHVQPPIADLRKPAADEVHDGGSFGPAAATASALLTNYGLRVPTFVVSPWVPPGKGPDIVLDHCSILKTILARFCADSKPFLSDRVDASQTFDAYLSKPSPRMNVPPPPPLTELPPEASPTPASPSRITTAPISRKKMLTGDVEFDDLTGTLARLLLGR